MEFRLRYSGPLKATQRDPLPGSLQTTKHAALKQSMRSSFNRQLRTLWKTTGFLSGNQDGPTSTKPYHIGRLSEKHQLELWKFVPLVTENLELITTIDIMLLRLDHPGSSLWSGDMDNRIKTLIDALEMPTQNDNYGSLHPTEDQQPLFCLLENDRLLTGVNVSTDLLLDPPEDAEPSYVDALITVRIRPKNLTFNNIGF